VDINELSPVQIALLAAIYARQPVLFPPHDKPAKLAEFVDKTLREFADAGWVTLDDEDNIGKTLTGALAWVMIARRYEI
jgi:membrane peptidoglycan carboxypeptidase